LIYAYVGGDHADDANEGDVWVMTEDMSPAAAALSSEYNKDVTR